MNLTESAFKNKPLVYFLLFVLIAGGAYSFFKMSKLEDPEIKVKQALVITVYPGASAHEVELQITDKLEKTIRSMGDIKTVESRSLDNYSEIKVELKSTTKKSELEQKWDILRRKIHDAQASMPDGAQQSMVVDDFGDVYGMFYAMTADGYSYEKMSDYADLVKREVQNIPGVSRVHIYGERTPCVNVEFRENKMANMGVHPAEILSTLNSQNKTVYAGEFNAGSKRLRVAVNDTYKSIDDIRNLLIQGHESDQIRLKDVATVTRGYKEPYSQLMRYDGQKAIGIAFSMEPGGNVISLGQKIDDKLAELQKARIPSGISFHKVFFQPDKVESAIKGFMINLLESVLIVIVILMITMGLRSGILIGSGLIITILGSFLFLNFFNGTLQRVSLASLIVAMGMLVDNAIVIVDGILVDLQNGVKKSKALRNTAQKTALPLLGATLIAIIAFLPIFLSPDTSGEYVRDLFIVLAVSLLLSWVLALTHIPIIAEKRFKKSKMKGDGKGAHQGKIYDFFRKTLNFLLYHRILTIGATILLLIITTFSFKYVKQGFFPDLSYNQLYIEYRAHGGTRIEQVNSDLHSIEQYLMKQPEVTHVTTSVGGTPARYNLVRSITLPSSNYGELIVDFTNPDVLKEKMDTLQRYLTAHYPQAYVRMKRYNLMYKEYPIEALFTGPDPAVLKQLASKAEDIMKAEPTATLVTNNWEPETPYLKVDYYQPLARQAGLSRSDVSLALLAATDGLPVGQYHEGRHTLPIYLKSTNAEGKPVQKLDNIPVWSLTPTTGNISPQELRGLLTGQTTKADLLEKVLGSKPLNQATKGISPEWEEPVVRRYNGERAIKAQCNNVPGHSPEEVRRNIKNKIEAIKLPDGYHLKWQGEYEASSDSQKYLFMHLPMAIILMIGILIALFKDFKKPAIILLSLPLASIGIVSGMLLSGKEFGFVAIVGALGLIGMMIKNGVVLIEEIGLQIESGKDRYQAIIDSSASRLRPVMMASLTTILGMLPLLPDDMFGSLAVTIMFGLLVGTLITLIFVPVLYSLFFHIHHPKREAIKK